MCRKIIKLVTFGPILSSMKFVFCFLWAVAAVGQTDIEKSVNFMATAQFAAAEKLLAHYVSNHPADLKGIELLGDAYGHQKKWNDAIEEYKKLVDLSPKTANYQYKYGGALGMKALSVSRIKALGIIGDVKKAFLTAADLDPYHVDTRWALVKLYMRLPGIIGGSKSKALFYAEELQQLSKVDGYLAKGFIYEFDMDLKTAEKYYKLALTEGGSLVCYEKLTKLYQLQNDPERAISNMEEALKQHQSNELHFQIGKVSAENNIELAKGAQHLRNYLAHSVVPDDMSLARAHYYLAKIYRLQNKKIEGRQQIDLALIIAPDNVDFKIEKTVLFNLP